MAGWSWAETEGFMERDCLLFEAGEYADKGVTISEADLEAIARNSPDEVPVKIEHLAESPFDGALGVVTKLRAAGSQLWGVLRQPLEAWRLAQRAGARSLSVGLDMEGMRLAETSFVCHPRVANAQVFSDGPLQSPTRSPFPLAPSPKFGRGGEDNPSPTSYRFGRGGDAAHFFPFPVSAANASGKGVGGLGGLARFETEGIFREGGRETMSSVKQLAEGLIGYLRGAANEESQTFAAERAALDAEKTRLRLEWADRQVLDWKRQGRIRGSERAAELARILLMQDDSSVVTFDGKAERLSALFAAFVQENGPTVPMGERMATDRFATLTGSDGAAARERLIALAQEKARKDGLGYVQSFAAVAAAHPDMAMAAREE